MLHTQLAADHSREQTTTDLSAPRQGQRRALCVVRMRSRACSPYAAGSVCRRRHTQRRGPSLRASHESVLAPPTPPFSSTGGRDGTVVKGKEAQRKGQPKSLVMGQ